MENQLTSYYTPAAIERLEIDFQDKINQFQKDNEIDKQQILTNAKNILNKEFEHEDKALVNIFQQNLKEQYVSIDKKFDEELKNYQEVYEWMIGDVSKYTSAVLTILSSSMNPTMEVHFKDIFPTSLSAISFDSTTTDPVYQIATISFNYTEYIIKNLLNN